MLNDRPSPALGVDSEAVAKLLARRDTASGSLVLDVSRAEGSLLNRNHWAKSSTRSTGTRMRLTHAQLVCSIFVKCKNYSAL